MGQVPKRPSQEREGKTSLSSNNRWVEQQSLNFYHSCFFGKTSYFKKSQSDNVSTLSLFD